MNKMRLIFIVLLLFLITITAFFFVNSKVFKDGESDKEIISEKEKEELIKDITNDINEDYVDEEDEDEDVDTEENKGYDQYLVANGYSDASNDVYYTKAGVLYHLILSTKEIIKVAEGISKIEYGKGTMIVYKDANFKVFVEDNYLTYID